MNSAEGRLFILIRLVKCISDKLLPGPAFAV